ncbi:MAG TPA: hypothetical protein VJB10_01405 [Candidatus Peribacteraceae bacterium]|nr:hypothetical protein [Candidatus Peribacteraceae bacterium]
MISYRSLAVLSLGLLLTQVVAPTASASSLRAARKPISSTVLPAPSLPDRPQPIPIPQPESIPFISTVDDGDRDFRTKGNWTVVPFAGWQSDFRFAEPQRNQKKTAQAEWNFTRLQPGTYEVLATWDSFPALATNATYEITTEAMPTIQAVANQAKPPVGDSFLGRTWQRLAEIRVEKESSVRVQLSNQANSFVLADGMALRSTGNPERGADLSFSVQGPGSLAPGEKFEYVLSATNNGPQDAYNVRMNLVYNPTLIVPLLIQPEEGRECRIEKPGTGEYALIVCDLGTLPANVATATPLTFHVQKEAPCGATIATKGSVSDERPQDPKPENNFGYTKALIQCDQPQEADLSLSVSYDDRTTPGGQVKYGINLANAGPKTAENTLVILSNPSMWLHYNAAVSDSRCKEIVRPVYDVPGEEAEEFSHAILCAFGDMGPHIGTVAPLVFKVDPDAQCNGTVRGLFEADSDTNDQNPSNNNVDTKVLVECNPLPATSMTVQEIPLIASATARAGQKNILLSRVEIQANEAQDILLTGLLFGEETNPRNLGNVQNYALWADTNGDSVVDTILQRNVSVSNLSQIRFGDMTGGGFVIPSNTKTAFEVHGDVAPVLRSDTIQLTLGTAARDYILAEELDGGTSLAGIETDGTCTADFCQIQVHTADSTLWHLEK